MVGISSRVSLSDPRAMDMLYDAWGGQTYELMPVKFDPIFMQILG